MSDANADFSDAAFSESASAGAASAGVASAGDASAASAASADAAFAFIPSRACVSGGGVYREKERHLRSTRTSACRDMTSAAVVKRVTSTVDGPKMTSAAGVREWHQRLMARMTLTVDVRK